MQISAYKGVKVSDNKSIIIDPASSLAKADFGIISHAHSDHARISGSKNFTTYLTPETRHLMNAKGMNLKNMKEIEFNKKIQLDEFSVELHNSGHVLGSAQIEIQNNSSCVVTNDFKLHDSIILEGAKPLKCDTLLIESTFGRKEFVFPERALVYEQMLKWMNLHLKQGKFLVLGGYSIGKAQELTKFCNDFLGINPLVHENIANANKVYEHFGKKLGNTIPLNHNLKESQILIMPTHLITPFLIQTLSFSLGKKIETALATGWNNASFFKTFPLSDHADFNQLMQYVKESSPKQVYTFHGFDSDFAKSVQKETGISAKPLNHALQKNLAEFG
ncbi:MAG: MBL fold metallo-hydrolase RNA specificity domain-containing protein [archaeon]|nr:MBL fold metallo-hydrolase RNA specificity domain-containing protein [archaeon]